MYVADKDLCKTLDELSGWNDTEKIFWPQTTDGKNVRLVNRDYPATGLESAWSAYDLGYVLRKLPNASIDTDAPYDVIYYLHRRGGYDTKTLHFKADTPEDAIVKLAIELFKQGVLTLEKGGAA